MKREYIRGWSAEEIVGRPPIEVVIQSNKLSESIKPILFGKHPGAQMLTLAELGALWVLGHEKGEERDQALELMVEAIREFVEKEGDK